MGLFYNRSGEEPAEKPIIPCSASCEDREIPKSATTGSLFRKRMSLHTAKLASNITSSIAKKKSSVTITAAVPEVNTDPNMTDSSDASHDRRSLSRQSTKSRRRTTFSTDSFSIVESCNSDERDDEDSYERGAYFHSPSSSYNSHSRTNTRRSTLRSKQSTDHGFHSRITSDMLRNDRSSMSQHMAHIFNPFANKGEVYLCGDMALVSDAMNLDLNTQIMLAYYDAKTLEDFCLISEDDLKDMIVNARSMRRTLPPLQIRKIEVLHEWVQEISKPPRDDSRFPAWIRFSPPRHSSRRKSKKLIPDDWKAQFRRDLPQLKRNLRKKGANLSGYSNFIPSFQSINMCGLVT